MLVRAIKKYNKVRVLRRVFLYPFLSLFLAEFVKQVYSRCTPSLLSLSPNTRIPIPSFLSLCSSSTTLLQDQNPTSASKPNAANSSTNAANAQGGHPPLKPASHGGGCCSGCVVL
jgi:hypothetical protein